MREWLNISLLSFTPHQSLSSHPILTPHQSLSTQLQSHRPVARRNCHLAMASPFWPLIFVTLSCSHQTICHMFRSLLNFSIILWTLCDVTEKSTCTYWSHAHCNWSQSVCLIKFHTVQRTVCFMKFHKAQRTINHSVTYATFFCILAPPPPFYLTFYIFIICSVRYRFWTSRTPRYGLSTTILLTVIFLYLLKWIMVMSFASENPSIIKCSPWWMLSFQLCNLAVLNGYCRPSLECDVHGVSLHHCPRITLRSWLPPFYWNYRHQCHWNYWHQWQASFRLHTGTADISVVCLLDFGLINQILSALLEDYTTNRRRSTGPLRPPQTCQIHPETFSYVLTISSHSNTANPSLEHLHWSPMWSTITHTFFKWCDIW